MSQDEKGYSSSSDLTLESVMHQIANEKEAAEKAADEAARLKALKDLAKQVSDLNFSIKGYKEREESLKARRKGLQAAQKAILNMSHLKLPLQEIHQILSDLKELSEGKPSTHILFVSGGGSRFQDAPEGFHAGGSVNNSTGR